MSGPFPQPDFRIVRGFQPYIPKGFSATAFTAEQWRILFEVDTVMHGETMHALCSSLLTNTFIGSQIDKDFQNNCVLPKLTTDSASRNPKDNDRAKLWKTGTIIPHTIVLSLAKASARQKELLGFFLPDQSKENTQPQLIYYSSDVKQGTDYKVFRELSTRAVAETLRTYPEPDQQQSIHAAIAAYLDSSGMTKPGKDFVSPSEFAFRHLNDYFQATYKTGLPDPKTVKRVVVIFVRRSAQAEDSRVMDKTTLIDSIDALVKANAMGTAFSAFNHKPVTHVLLYGDIGVEDASELSAKYASSKSNIQINALSSAFFADKANPTGNDIWQHFKNDQLSTTNPLPFEAKVNGIFMALRKLYGGNLAFLGWRSGSLDVPAFLGSPIFSLDNKIAEDERFDQSRTDAIKKLDPPYDPSTLTEEGRYKAQENSRNAAYAAGNTLWAKCFQDATYLFDLQRYGTSGHTYPVNEKMERMEAISASANTWITINSPLKYGQNDVVGDVKPFQIKSYVVGVKNHDVLRLEEAKAPLAAAVAVWLCCEDKDTKPLWTKRHFYMRDIGKNKWLVKLFDDALNFK